MIEAQETSTPVPTAAFWTLRVVPIFALLCLFAIGGHAKAGDNILVNGDLTRGSGNQPDHWKTDAWKNEPSYTTYHWDRATNELEISSTKPNDARWAQSVHLDPGWYHFTADIRTEGVGQDPNLGGGCLAILEDGIVSQQLRGTNNWQTMGLYLKVGNSSADLQVACRLGGYASLNTGKVFCRNLQAVKIAAPPANAAPEYDLDQIRGGGTAPAPAASHASNTVLMILIALATLLIVGLIEGKRFLGGAIEAIGSALRRTRLSPKRAPSARQHLLEEPGPEEAPLEEEAFLEEEVELPQEVEEPRERGRTNYLPMLAIAVAAFCVAILAIRRLDGTAHAVNFTAGLRGLTKVLPETGVAVLKLWSFWALSAAVVAGLLLQFAPEMELFDVILAGAGGVWVIAWLLGHLLGPIGLFRPVTIWVILAAGIFQIWRRPPTLRRTPLTAGQKLALLGCRPPHDRHATARARFAGGAVYGCSVLSGFRAANPFVWRLPSFRQRSVWMLGATHSDPGPRTVLRDARDG